MNSWREKKKNISDIYAGVSNATIATPFCPLCEKPGNGVIHFRQSRVLTVSFNIAMELKALSSSIFICAPIFFLCVEFRQ